MLRGSVSYSRYDVAFEVGRVFIKELLTFDYLPVFDDLVYQLQNDPTYFEMKLALLEVLMPVITKQQAFKFMKVFESVIGNDYHSSIFKVNLNPLRLGLQLYMMIDVMAQASGYSENTARGMQDEIDSQLQKVLESFESEDIVTLIVTPDFEGRNCFWYFQKYELFSLLELNVMSKYLNQKWSGDADVNCSMFQYSASYKLLTDRHD